MVLFETDKCEQNVNRVRCLAYQVSSGFAGGQTPPGRPPSPLQTEGGSGNPPKNFPALSLEKMKTLGCVLTDVSKKKKNVRKLIFGAKWE